MDNNTKIIHEFFYVVGHKDFHSCYKLVVDRETEKMLYGDALNNEGNAYGRFSIKKSDLNKVKEIVDKKYGLVLRIQIDEKHDYDIYEDAKMKIFYHLYNIAENFRMHKRED